jgi:hypothetical protein
MRVVQLELQQRFGWHGIATATQTYAGAREQT